MQHLVLQTQVRQDSILRGFPGDSAFAAPFRAKKAASEKGSAMRTQAPALDLQLQADTLNVHLTFQFTQLTRRAAGALQQYFRTMAS